MQFHVGDQVVHPVYGVGTIKTCAKRQFGKGKTRRYYEVIAGRVTVWVPINEQGFTVLRRVASKATLDECRKLLKSHPVPLDKSIPIREVEIANRLKVSLLPGLCEIVRDLRALSQQNPLGRIQGDLLRKSYKALCDEWAAVDGVPVQIALNEIESMLQATYPARTLERDI
jgi:RNA polymerase-interacting CarD/CdnL/TRCF family regulator